MEERFNGWHNRQTWLADLHLTNEEATQKALETAAGAAIDGCNGDRQQAAGVMADLLRDYVTNNAPDVCGLYSDLLAYAIASIDYLELGRAFVDGVPDSGTD